MTENGNQTDCIIIVKSRKNNNVYHMFKDRIEVVYGSGKTEIPLPVDYLVFYDLYYINNKLYAIVVTGEPYDARFEIDEEKCELTGKAITTY